jgi:hypothetical protein
MRLRFLIFASAAVLSAPASAGLVADYRNVEDGSTIKVETSDTGESRLQYSNQQFFIIVRGGDAYVIYTVTPEPRVTRVADLQKVMGEVPPSVQVPSNAIDQVQIVPTGNATIAGYAGRAYAIRTANGTSPRPVLVVSDDPKLRGIGVPLARQLDFSIATMRLAGKGVPPNFLRMRELIGDGAALVFAGYRLESLKTAVVDAKEFELPGAPMSVDELRRNAEAAARLRQ